MLANKCRENGKHTRTRKPTWSWARTYWTKPRIANHRSRQSEAYATSSTSSGSMTRIVIGTAIRPTRPLQKFTRAPTRACICASSCSITRPSTTTWMTCFCLSTRSAWTRWRVWSRRCAASSARSAWTWSWFDVCKSSTIYAVSRTPAAPTRPFAVSGTSTRSFSALI